ncbi:MAG: EAL domain-containing protein [Woeseiaceae bacterium]|nr:EAL domain-containing protein [Woeseiaceae bacterium]
MRKANIAAYLDSGSMSLFAEQIASALGNVVAVAVHDNAGRLVWSGPDAGARELWGNEPFLRERMPADGFCERLGNGNYAYVFYLSREEDEVLFGTLGIQIDSSHPVSVEYARKELEPVIDCIERQIDINAELSAVRRLSDEGRKGMQLLMQMDELDESNQPIDTLRQLIKMTAKHYGAELAAVLLPNLGIQETWPASLRDNKRISKSVMSTLGSLIASAKLHRQVLLSDANMKTHVSRTGMEPKILCSPIINARDDVIGVLVLICDESFSKDQVRLSRAICAKINTLMRSADRMTTDHYSRHGFMRHVANILSRNPNQHHAVIHVDIDKLHTVNDSFGHMAGDQVIRSVAAILDEISGSGDVITHLSGDTFGLFLRDCDAGKAQDKADLILDTIGRKEVEYDGKVITISASIGIALIPDVVSDAAAALNTAEVAARSAKGRGGNRIVVFRDADASVAQRRSDLDQVAHLQAALIEDRFVLYAQPIRPLTKDENVHRYEILVRMSAGNGKTLPPGTFLSAAERYQMMSSIDRWVIRNTLDQLANADNLLEISLGSFSINISAQSLADDDFPTFLESQIVESGVSPDSLCFEITETAIVRSLERAQRCIRRLRKLGCRVALDDFGTGYCSFAYLKDLPVQYIKIDGVFVRDILENPLSEAIVASTARIADVMNATTIAEHVENELVLQRLRQHDIALVQGFAIGKPAPLEKILSDMGPPVILAELSDRSA